MKIKKLLPILSLFVLTVLLSCMLGAGVCAAEPDSASAPAEISSAQTDDGTGTKAIAAAAVVGVVWPWPSPKAPKAWRVSPRRPEKSIPR